MPYEYDSSGANTSGSSGNDDLVSWIIVVAALVFFWPVGLFLLFRKLRGYSVGGAGSHRDQQRQRHPYDIQQDAAAGTSSYRPTGGASGTAQAQSGSTGQTGARREARYEYRYQTAQTQSAPTAGNRRQQPGTQGVYDQQSRGRDGRFLKRRRPVDLKKGRGMTVWGGILAGVFGFTSAISFPAILLSEGLFTTLAVMTPLLGFTGLGLVLLVCGTQRSKKAKRLRKYLALIGKRESISIATLAQAMPVSYHTACDDLQEMLDEGYIATGYLDMSSGRMILNDEGLREPAAEPQAEPEEEKGRTEEDDNAVLEEIRQVNDAIADPEMSRKIDRIGEITGKILDYQRKNPDKNGQLRSFLSYYLPTTLKILKAYAQMEAQGVEGENIRSAKERIEGMMDKVVEGFEKQLDKLFQDDAMDITTDVEVLERMLDKDGLSDSGSGFTLGGV